MKKDSRLSSALHALLHMAGQQSPTTSENLAKCLGTNPVVVRRTVGLLRKAGIVTSGRGHAGGWSLNASLDAVTLLDLHKALGESALFAIGSRNATTPCLIEQSVNTAINDTFAEAEVLLLKRFSEITLAALATDLACRHTKRSQKQ